MINREFGETSTDWGTLAGGDEYGAVCLMRELRKDVLRAKISKTEPRRAQESPEKLRRAKESLGESVRAQENPGEPRKAQPSQPQQP